MGARNKTTRAARAKAELVPAPGSTIALQGEREVDTALLDRTVAEVNRHYTIKGLETMRLVGEYLLETFFDGDPANFRDRASDHATFRELANREDLHVSYAFLWRAVSVTDQLRLLPGDVAEALPPTHHALLLPLRDEERKVDLARQAAEGGWSKRKLEGEVKKLRAREKAAGGVGRPALPAFVKTIHAWNKYADGDEALFGDLDQVDELDPGEAEALWKTVTGLKLRCEKLQKALEPRVPGFASREG